MSLTIDSDTFLVSREHEHLRSPSNLSWQLDSSVLISELIRCHAGQDLIFPTNLEKYKAALLWIVVLGATDQ